MACESQTFEITPDQFAALAAKLKAAVGIEISGESGEASAQGYKFSYSYDGKKLVLTCLTKPFMVPCFGISSKVASLVAEV